MKRWLPFAAAGGLVLAVVAASAIVLSAQDVGPLKGLIEQKVYEKTGRHLVIDGNFGLSISFSPAIRATGVRFENAPWAAEPAMLRLKEVEAKVALIPMMFGKIEVKRLVLTDAEVFLEIAKDGRKNWEFKARGASAGTAPAPAAQPAAAETPAQPLPSGEEATPSETKAFELPVVENIRVENLRLVYKDGKTGAVRTIALDEVTGAHEGADAPFEFAAKGTLDGAPVELEGTFGPGMRDAPLELSGAAAGAALEVSGTITDPLALGGLDLALQAKGQSLSALNPLIGGGLPEAGPYAVSGRLTGANKAYALDDLRMTLGNAEATGRIRLDLAGTRPVFDADLAAGTLDLKAFSEGSSEASVTEPQGSGVAAAAEADGAAKTERIFSEKPLPIAALRSADGKAHLRAAKLIAGKLAIEDLDLTLTLKNGRLAVEPLEGTLAQGRIGGSLSLDGAQAAPALALNAKLTGADFAALTDKEKIGRFVGGRLDARIEVKGEGASMRAVASGLNGGLSAHLVGGRELPEWLEYALGRDLLSSLAFWNGGEAPRLNCFVAGLTFKDGIGTFDDLIVDTSHATISGTGSLNLKSETLDLTVVPRPKDASLLSVALPVKVEGPLRRPDWAIDRKAAALDLAKSVAGNALLGPLGLVLPLVDEGSGEDDPCAAALARIEEGAKAPAPSKDKASPSEPNPVQELLKGLENIF